MTRSALCGKCGLRGLHRRPGSGGAEVRIGPGQSLGEADGGATAKALDYSLKRWPALMRYAERHAERAIDNLRQKTDQGENQEIGHGEAPGDSADLIGWRQRLKKRNC